MVDYLAVKCMRIEMQKMLYNLVLLEKIRDELELQSYGKNFVEHLQNLELLKLWLSVSSC